MKYEKLSKDIVEAVGGKENKWRAISSCNWKSRG